jgi:hypothetical protein
VGQTLTGVPLPILERKIMAAPTNRVARNDGSSTIVTNDWEPEIGTGGASIPNRAVANETLPATYTIGQAQNSAAAVAGQYNTDAVLTLPGERPLPQQE